MITFITALYPEAKSLIQILNLKQNPNEHLYRLFEGDGFCLCITGSGMISAASCVARHFSLYPPKSSDLVINLGIAGYTAGHTATISETVLPGNLYLVTKITEQATGRTFYPDLLYRNDFKKLPATTVCTPVSDNAAFPAETLIDMEASALYQALLPFITPERMFFFKVVSDVPGSKNHTTPVTPALTEQLIDSHAEKILAFIKDLSQSLTGFFEVSFTPEEKRLKKELYDRLPLTDSTRKEVERLLRYIKLTGNSPAPLLTDFFSCLPDTPVRGKKQAAPYLEKLHELVLLHAPLCTDEWQTISGHYAPFYTTTYVEEALLTDTASLPDHVLKTGIPISHYKDVFNRSHQNFAEQKKAPALIYAKKTGTLIYEGAPVCQSFGNEHFYYTSCMMNCIYHCDYCYLQGMYPSGHTVVFVNLDDYFAEVELLLKKHPVYLCVSYDTDLLALESSFHFVARWLDFAKLHHDLTLEIRTKSGNAGIFKELGERCGEAKHRIIFAWTVSPDHVASRTEHGAPSPALRLRALKAAKLAGFSVRLCFDPMIYHSGWKSTYEELIKSTFNIISPADLYDVSIGVFRISTEYLKNMRKKRPDSAIVQFPYITENGVSHYGPLSEEMIHYLRKLLLEYLPEEKIFIWDGGNS